MPYMIPVYNEECIVLIETKSGHTAYGPFDSKEDATAWGDHFVLEDESYSIVTLFPVQSDWKDFTRSVSIENPNP